jgi:hypothetical protein
MLSVHPDLLMLGGKSVNDLLEVLQSQYGHLYLIEPGFPYEEKPLSATLNPLQYGKIPDKGFVLWCSGDSLL